METNQLTN